MVQAIDLSACFQKRHVSEEGDRIRQISCWTLAEPGPRNNVNERGCALLVHEDAKPLIFRQERVTPLETETPHATYNSTQKTRPA